jgi:hypothetical protein
MRKRSEKRNKKNTSEAIKRTIPALKPDFASTL